MIEEAETGYDKTEYLDADWAVFQSALTDAKVALNKDKQDQKQIEDAYYALKAAMMTLDTASGTEADDKYDIASDKYTVEAGSAQPQSEMKDRSSSLRMETEALTGIQAGAPML